MRLRDPEIGVIVFMSAWSIKIVRHCPIIITDATFNIAPIGFRQLYTVHGLYVPDSDSGDGEFVPLAFALMQNKSTNEFLLVISLSLGTKSLI